MSLKQRLGFTTEPLYIMDGTAFLYRGYFAKASMTRSDGLPTGALYIVGRVLLKLLKEERPAHFAFVLDGPGKNFRHEMFAPYKANRPSAPEGLVAQIEPVKRLVRTLGIHVEVSDGCEADDCLASLAQRFRGERPVIMVGVDKDLRQCLHDNVVLWDPAAREEKLVTLASFREETGLEPNQWPDVQALIGDSSDNVPGVRGVGQKTAEKLFHDFHSIEDILERMDSVPPAVRKKLEGQDEAMYLYRRLTTLSVDCCPNLSLESLALQPVNERDALTLLREFEMGSLLKELEGLTRRGLLQTGESQAAQKAGSQTLDAIGQGSREKRGNANSGASHGGAANSGQLSLLSSAMQAVDPLPKTGNVADLPHCAGLVISLTPPPMGSRVDSFGGSECVAVVGVANPDFSALSGNVSEILYVGPVEDLAAWAADAAMQVTPDLKKWLRTNPTWPVNPMRCFDLGLAAYLLAPEERDYSWPRLSARHADFSGLAPERPAALALDLCRHLQGQLAESDLQILLRDLEMPLVPVLADMEEAGVMVDRDALGEFLGEVQRQLDGLTARIYEAAGGEFNIRSAQQIGEVLYKRLGLPTAKATKGGQASTSQEVLEKLTGHHPVVDTLLEFRKLEKLRSTYLEPLPRLAGPDGRIHSTFNQTATATGRLSSSNPNLQNIPVRGDLGRRMRTCFTASKGNSLVSADYSQIELRVLAHYSQDPTLLAAFRSGEDIHTRTAALLHDVDAAAITQDQRRGAKTINFGLIYGMGARKLAQELNISHSEAKEFMERYFARFASIKEFFDRVEEQAREQGFVITLSGRRRPLPDMVSQSAQSRALAERQAVNTLVQGSAADIIKIAMLAVGRDEALRAMQARLILQVHDELLLEVPIAHAENAGQRMALLMTELPELSLSVPLSVDWGQGPHWGSAH